jgi:Tol biopolymer transport system component
LLSPDGSLLAYPEGGRTLIERPATGERWAVPAAGRAVQFSPDGARIAWQTASSTVNFDRRLVEVWVSDVTGENSRPVTRLVGGALLGWFPDSARLLAAGRETVEGEPALFLVDVATGAVGSLVRIENVRGTLISPGGGWIAYQIAFTGDPARDGFWVTSVADAQTRKLPVFGAYRWRSEGRLLVVPLELGAPSHRVVEVDAATGEMRALTDPVVTSFKIAGGEWALSPDGGRLVFVSAADHNLWLLELPH